MRDFRSTRFDEEGHSAAIGDLPNLADLMLVFAVGLIAAMATASGGKMIPEVVEAGEELPQLPGDAQADGSGLEAVGRVFQDPDTGKMYVIRSSSEAQ
ncbi:MAG: hypothetical protein AAF749_11860 [Pseudomonadota bacterium]